MQVAVNYTVVVEKGHRHTLTDHFRGTTKMVVRELDRWASANDRFIPQSFADILRVLASRSLTGDKPIFCACCPRSIRRALKRLRELELLVPAVTDGVDGFLFKRHADATERLTFHGITDCMLKLDTSESGVPAPEVPPTAVATPLATTLIQ